MRIIAFTGPKGSGKDTAARFLLARNSLEGRNIFEQMNFADPLKQACRVIFGFTEAELSDPLLKEKVVDRFPYKTPREVLQHVALTFRTLYSPEIWVIRWQSRLAEGTGECIVVTDLRHPEELRALQEYGAFIIYVDNPAVEKSMRNAQLAATGDLPVDDPTKKSLWNDPSESFYALMRHEASATILNNGSIDMLHNQVYSVVTAHYGMSWSEWLGKGVIKNG